MQDAMDILNQWPYYILVDDAPVRVDFETYARWMNEPQHKIVARTYLSREGADVLPYKDALRLPRQGYALVSTVFLGTDHGWAWQLPGAEPILFETMVAIRNPDVYGGLEFLSPQWRYTSAEAAKAMHERVVTQARAWLREGGPLIDKDTDEWPE